jgi:hypothetical protein
MIQQPLQSTRIIPITHHPNILCRTIFTLITLIIESTKSQTAQQIYISTENKVTPDKYLISSTLSDPPGFLLPIRITNNPVFKTSLLGYQVLQFEYTLAAPPVGFTSITVELIRPPLPPTSNPIPPPPISPRFTLATCLNMSPTGIGLPISPLRYIYTCRLEPT